VKTEFFTQPETRLGDLIEEQLDRMGAPVEFIIVSAFASLPTVLRFKPRITEIVASGADVRMTLGVDLGGTSKEVLQQVFTWPVPVMIVKNRQPGTIFHPKIYVMRWRHSAVVIVGSSNLTDGGLYRNYEASTITTFNLPDDETAFRDAIRDLGKFLTPAGPTAALLTQDYLDWLVSLPEIPSEAQARRARGEAIPKRPPSPNERHFGFERVNPAPRLPTELQQLLLLARQQREAMHARAVRHARKAARVAGSTFLTPAKPSLPTQLDPEAFYMTLPATKGATNPTIPGEPRIPLAARDMAEDFWGWPDNYEREESPRLGPQAKEVRVYHNWRPRWRVWSTDDPTNIHTLAVRMYFYENSSDFRFYAGPLGALHAEADDIVRIRRIDVDDAVYECVLARKGTPEHAQWEPLLVNSVRSRNSTRRFGFT
jgi:hypothetical protein